MALHLLKVCVGIDSVAHLADVQKARLKRRKKLVHLTRHRPKRAEEILAGGSLYWIVKGAVLVRQRILGLDWAYLAEDGRYCAIKLDPKLVATVPQPRRPHRGWRYLDAADAPSDAKAGPGRGRARMPPELASALKLLGLL
jgi:hypothetical protein